MLLAFPQLQPVSVWLSCRFAYDCLSGTQRVKPSACLPWKGERLLEWLASTASQHIG